MTYSIELTEKEINILIKHYQGLQITHTNNYTRFRAKIKSSTLTIFNTKKILVQGNDCTKLYSEICSLLDLKCPVEDKDAFFKKNYSDLDINLGTAIIGSDEVGTGDYFGGIVTACCFVPKDKILFLKQMGVKDSKLLSDNQIKHLATLLKKEIPYAVLLLNNEKYNEITNIENMNLNKIKAIMHNKVLLKILSKFNNLQYEAIIIDGFTTKDKYYQYLNNIVPTVQNVQLLEKGEEKYVAIAAASIIARYYFLSHLENLEKKSGYKIIRGASYKVDQLAKQIIIEKGEQYLNKMAKLNFKNTKKALK